MSQETKRFEFGDYVLDAGEKVLLRDGRSIPIPPKVFDLLLVLVENHGHVVEKEVLMERLWEGTFVEESNLTFSVRKLRKILGDDTQNPEFIETVPKRGYRFIAVTNSNNDVMSQPEPVGVVGSGLATDIKERSSPVRKRSYLLWTVISVILLVGLSALFWWLTADKPSSISSIKFERVTYNGKTKFAAGSPDGKFVAYIIDDENGQSIWLRNVATESDVQILPATADTQLHSVTFSHDGDYIYYVAGDTLYKLPILGGLPREVLRNFGVGSQFKPFAFSPDGSQLAFIRPVSESESALVILNSDGSGERILASSQGRGMFRRSAVWSPDGKLIALVGSGSPSIMVVHTADGTISPVPSPPWTVVSQIAWQPDGHGFFVVATEGQSSYAQIWRLSYPDGNAENITNDFNNYQSISLTADGRLLVAVRVEQVAHIWVTLADGGNPRQLTHGIDRYDGIHGLSWLSNNEIVYEATPGGKGQIWTIDAAGSRKSKLILSESSSSAASPDGKYIVFKSSGDPDGDGLFRLDVGSGEKLRLTMARDVWVTFSPDARWVVFTRWESGADLWRIPTEGGEAVNLTNVQGYAMAPAVSPDSSQIAFHWIKQSRNQPPEIALIPFEGGSVVKTFPLPSQHPRGFGKNGFQWTSDGRAIDYAVFRDNVSNIWRQPIDGGKPFQVTNFTEQQIFNFAYSPDGKNLALSRGTYARDVVLLRSDPR